VIITSKKGAEICSGVEYVLLLIGQVMRNNRRPRILAKRSVVEGIVKQH
jgi:hypothetical protein